MLVATPLPSLTQKKYCNNKKPDGLYACYLDYGHQENHAAEAPDGSVVEWTNENDPLQLLSRLERDSVARDERIAVALESIAESLRNIAISIKFIG